MGEVALSRIPFLRRDELMIASMVRWMRFIAVIKIIGSLLTAFLVLVGLIYFGTGMGTGQPGLGKVGPVIAENRLLFLALGIFVLTLAIAGTILGYLLYQAADDFDRVARTDEADQDYVTSGLVRLKLYFQVSILLAFAAVLAGISAGAVLVIKTAAVS